MTDPAAPLPIDDALPALRRAVADRGCAVLVAPPGAGKTTRVPLSLLDLIPGRIVMLEPRRLAARAARADQHDRAARCVGDVLEHLGDTTAGGHVVVQPGVELTPHP